MAAPVVALNVPTYATYTPYITTAEFLAEPTGVDTTQLIPGGTSAQNTAALARKIAQASSYADDLCYQVLAATSDVQSGEYRLRRDGAIHVPVANSPLIQVDDVQVGVVAGQLTPLDDLSGVWLGRKVARIPVTRSLPALTITGRPGVAAGPGRVFAAVTYVNGYAHTLLAASVAQGASQITVKGALGLVPGLPLTIYDNSSTEQVTVDAGYTLGSTTVPLTAPLANNHTAPVSVSALPPFVREAVVNLTAYLIKTREARRCRWAPSRTSPASSTR